MYFFSLLLNNDDMKTMNQIHRENLQALVDEFESVTVVAGKIGCSDSQYSQWLNGSTNSGTGKPRGLGAKSARRIEVACGKPIGWMDREHQEFEVVAKHAAAHSQANAATTSDLQGLTCETAEEIGLLTAYRLAKKLGDRLTLLGFDSVTEEFLSRVAAERKKR